MQINANILMIVQQSDRFDATAVSSMILKINQTKLRDGWKWLDLSHIANWTQMGRLIEYFMQKEFFFRYQRVSFKWRTKLGFSMNILSSESEGWTYWKWLLFVQIGTGRAVSSPFWISFSRQFCARRCKPDFFRNENGNIGFHAKSYVYQ